MKLEVNTNIKKMGYSQLYSQYNREKQPLLMQKNYMPEIVGLIWIKSNVKKDCNYLIRPLLVPHALTEKLVGTNIIS